MATYYPKTSLSIRTKDNNENTKTFSVGYVNGDAPDGTLKQLALKVVDLSNLALTEVYKTEQTNLTNASTDTNIAGVIFKSSSPFFSDDSDTFTAAVSELGTPETGSVIFQCNYTPSDEKGAVVRVANWKSVNSLTNLINFINYTVTANAPTFIKEVKFEKVANGIWGYNTVGYTNHNMKITGNYDFGKAIVSSLYENRIAVEGYNVNYTEDGDAVNIRITKA